jgi:hypothetical protein
MLYSEIIAVCSQIHTKHINTRCGQNVELWMLKHVIYLLLPLCFKWLNKLAVLSQMANYIVIIGWTNRKPPDSRMYLMAAKTCWMYRKINFSPFAHVRSVYY